MSGRSSVEAMRSWNVDELGLLRLRRVEVLGDILVLNGQSFQGEDWAALWSAIASAGSVVRGFAGSVELATDGDHDISSSDNHVSLVNGDHDISANDNHVSSVNGDNDISSSDNHVSSVNGDNDISANDNHVSSVNDNHVSSVNGDNDISANNKHDPSVTANQYSTNTSPIISTPPLSEREKSLLRLLADCYHCQRVGVHEEIDCGPKRQSHSHIVFSQREEEDGWVTVKQNGILYSWPFERVMFASGNNTERKRMGDVRAANQVVVDLYAVREFLCRHVGHWVLHHSHRRKGRSEARLLL